MVAAAAFLMLAAAFLGAMIGLSLWAERQLPDGPVPVHFDIKGRADAFGSRWVALGILPLSYIVIAAASGLLVLAQGDRVVEELLVSQLVLGVSLLAAHGFIVFLLLRWARNR